MHADAIPFTLNVRGSTLHLRLPNESMLLHATCYTKSQIVISNGISRGKSWLALMLLGTKTSSVLPHYTKHTLLVLQSRVEPSTPTNIDRWLTDYMTSNVSHLTLSQLSAAAWLPDRRCTGICIYVDGDGINGVSDGMMIIMVFFHFVWLITTI